MNNSSANPYEPPASKAEQSTRQSGSLAVCIFSALLTMVFAAITTLGLLSTEPERWLSLPLAVTTILLARFTFAVYHSTRRGVFFGVAASAFQTVYMVAFLLYLGPANGSFEATVSTILPIVAITAWSWIRSRQHD